MRFLLSGLNQSEEDVAGEEISCGSDTASIVGFTRTFDHYVYDAFQSLGPFMNAAREKKNSCTQWFEIVYGSHLHAALLKLMEFDCSKGKFWEAFHWYATFVQEGRDLERY